LRCANQSRGRAGGPRPAGSRLHQCRLLSRSILTLTVAIRVHIRPCTAHNHQGDLQRGRLQEAGAIQVLEQLWTGMMHNVDGEASVAMREEAQVALRAVRGGGESLGLRTPPISGRQADCVCCKCSMLQLMRWQFTPDNLHVCLPTSSSTPFSSSRASSPGSGSSPRRSRYVPPAFCFLCWCGGYV